MRDYELVLVISPEISDDDLPATLDKLNRAITQKGGTVQEVQRWGRRKLSYPLKRFKEGSYVLERLSMEPKDTSELESGLRVSEEVLRHILAKKDKHSKAV